MLILKAKIFLILYPPLKNPTTCIAITGWGRTQNPSIDNESDVVFSTKLQRVPVLISNDKCQKGDKFEVDPQIQLCAGGEKG